MARDYKKKPAAKRSASAKTSSTSALIMFVFGLTLGLAAAFGVHQHHIKQPTSNHWQANTSPTIQAPASTAPTPAATPASTDAPVEPRFTFYDAMPNYEVSVPAAAKTGRGAAAITPPKPAPTLNIPYVLQASSFLNMQDAERLKAELTLVGLEPYIETTQRASTTWHRVRIGPFNNQQQLQTVRRQLQSRGLHPLAIKHQS